MSSADIPIDAALVRRLIAAQFPEWADLPVRPVQNSGWDNRTFHLGEEMLVRLPSGPWYALAVEKEQRWLPRLARELPLPIPVPLGKGEPGEGYPFAWSVYGWLDGEVARPERIGDLTEFAAAIADFLRALQRIDPAGGPPPGKHNFFRGAPLHVYDAETREALQVLDGKIDTETALAAWEAALASTWDRPPVWFHGDVALGNLLLKDGRLAAVIDFGTSGVGDPACDLVIAWTLFEGESREVFRAMLPLDEGAWARGRGWALWKALILHAATSRTNAVDARGPAEVIEEVLAEHRRMG